MAFLRIHSRAEAEGFGANEWGIREPPLTNGDAPRGALGAAGEPWPSVVFVPGVAFSRACDRLGHGKAYYDTFFDALESAGAVPLLVGLAFDEQIFDEIPTEAHDRPLDLVVTPSFVFER